MGDRSHISHSLVQYLNRYPGVIKGEIHVSRLSSVLRSWNGTERIGYSFLVIEKGMSKVIPRRIYRGKGIKETQWIFRLVR